MSPVLRALASPKGLKGKNPRPSAAVRRILGAKKPTKGGGGRRPPPPFVGFCATQNCSDWCWSLGFFPFNPLGLARALKTGLIGGWARRNTKSHNFLPNFLLVVFENMHKYCFFDWFVDDFALEFDGFWKLIFYFQTFPPKCQNRNCLHFWHHEIYIFFKNSPRRAT